MKKTLLYIAVALLVLGMVGCKKQTETPDTPERPKGFDSFREQTEEMTVEEAETYLKENTDNTTPAYKEAVYTVTENNASEVIKEAREKQKETAAVKELFQGVVFRFREGTDFADLTIKQKLFMRGNWEPGEDGWYTFTFIDRTLSEGAVSMENDHSLNAYTQIIELLLSDSNVVLKQ